MRDRFFDIYFLGQRMLGECNSFAGGGIVLNMQRRHRHNDCDWKVNIAWKIIDEETVKKNNKFNQCKNIPKK